MALIVIGAVAAAGAFGYLVYKHGYEAAIAAVVAFGSAVALAASDLVNFF